MPGGSNLQIQYNNAGAFGGVAGSSWDGTTLTLPLLFVANQSATAFQVGNATSGALIGLDLTNFRITGLFNGGLRGSISFGAGTGNDIQLSPAGGGAVNLTGNLQISGTQVVGPRITGYGTPTGNVQLASFPGATATLAQTSAELAQLITDLKTHGLLGI